MIAMIERCRGLPVRPARVGPRLAASTPCSPLASGVGIGAARRRPRRDGRLVPTLARRLVRTSPRPARLRHRARAAFAAPECGNRGSAPRARHRPRSPPVRSNGRCGRLGARRPGLAGAAVQRAVPRPARDDAEALKPAPPRSPPMPTPCWRRPSTAPLPLRLGAALSGAGLPMPCNCNSSARGSSRQHIAAGLDRTRLRCVASRQPMAARGRDLDRAAGGQAVRPPRRLDPNRRCGLDRTAPGRRAAGSPGVAAYGMLGRPWLVAGDSRRRRSRTWASAAEGRCHRRGRRHAPLPLAVETPCRDARANDASTCDAPRADEAPATGGRASGRVARRPRMRHRTTGSVYGCSRIGMRSRNTSRRRRARAAELPAYGATAPATAVAASASCHGRGAAPGRREAPEAPKLSDLWIQPATPRPDPLASEAAAPSCVVAYTFSRPRVVLIESLRVFAWEQRAAGSRQHARIARSVVAATAISLSDCPAGP